MKYFQILLVALLLVSCATVRVNYDYDKAVDFSKYKTYHYYKDLETGLSELDTKRLIMILDQELRSRGYSQSETPDIFINITSSAYENPERNSVGIGVGGRGRNVGGGVSIGLPLGGSQYSRQIIFDFVDENGKGLIWQAVSESNYHPNASPDKRTANLRTVVKKVLEGFPPNK